MSVACNFHFCKLLKSPATVQQAQPANQRPPAQDAWGSARLTRSGEATEEKQRVPRRRRRPLQSVRRGRFPLIPRLRSCVYNSTTGCFHGAAVNDLQMPPAEANQGAAVSHRGPQGHAPRYGHAPPPHTPSPLLRPLQALGFTVGAPLHVILHSCTQSPC